MSYDVASADQNNIIRLKSDIVPLKYQLNLTLDPRSDNFKGIAVIDLKLSSSAQSIVLHAEELDFDAVYIEQQNRRSKAEIFQLAKDGTIALHFEKMLQPGLAQLTFNYHAKFSKGLEGLYKVVDGKQKSVFTQFQAIGARRAFPCFDEPGFKAIFDITIHAPKNFIAISNTQEIATLEESSNFVGHRFAITKPLPTYLIVFAVGDFDVVIHAPIPASKTRATPVPLRGIAMRGRGKALKFALDLTAKILLAEEEYFGVAYPFDKLDILAVPDMGAGGMENAGAITYDEGLVLLDHDSTLQRRREFLSLHAHEIAHHWFGNLITPSWWDDLWLNESFATFMETKFSNLLEPDWRFDVDIIKNSHQAMLLDRAKSVRSVHQEVSSTDGISAAFDEITYQKGAVILAMLENSLGEKEFQSFVHELLVTHAFGSITSDEFTASLQLRKNGGVIAKIFTSYIENSGLPVVRVTKKNSSMQISQSPYQMDGFEKALLNQKIWDIPVCISSLDNQNRSCEILSSRTKSLENSFPADASVVPVDDIPRYYVFSVERYDWLNILDAVPKMSRARALAVAISYDIAFLQDQVSLQDYLNGIERIAAHPDWEVAGFPIERLDFLLSGTPPSSPLFKYVHKKAVEIYSKKLTTIGLKKSFAGKNIHSWLLEIERADLVDFFVVNNLEITVDKYLAKLGKKINQSGNIPLDDNDLVPHDVVEAALTAAAKRGGESFLHQALSRLGKSSDAYEREIWLHAIAASRSPAARTEIEKLLLSDFLRNQEVPLLLFARAAIPEFRDEIWDVVDRHPTALLARLDGDLDITLIQIADGFVTEAQAQRVERTITPLLGQLRGGAIQLKQTLEHIRSHEFFLRRLIKQFAQ